MYVTRDHEWQTIQEVCKKLKAFDTSPLNTCVAVVSPECSSTVGMHLAHYLAKGDDLLDMKVIDLPFVDEFSDIYYDYFLDPKSKDGIRSFHLYKKVILVSAGIITGKNYTFLKNVFTLHDIETITVAQYENASSQFQSDVVGEYYEGELKFYWEHNK